MIYILPTSSVFIIYQVMPLFCFILVCLFLLLEIFHFLLCFTEYFLKVKIFAEFIFGTSHGEKPRCFSLFGIVAYTKASTVV